MKTHFLVFYLVAILLLFPSLTSAQMQSDVRPSEATRTRLQGIIKGILAAWDKFDVVCLGEDHGSRNDSDLRIALVEDPAFARKVRVIMIESASVTQQDVLDRFVLDGEEMPRDKLRIVWGEASGAEVWESPIYEAFIRAVRNANLKLPREQRVRMLAGDNPKQSNRGRFIREAVAREILDKGLKGLTIYGAGHCENRAMGYPGEIGDKYPGRIWSVFQFYNVDEGRRVFGLGDGPALIPITGTDQSETSDRKDLFHGSIQRPFDARRYGQRGCVFRECERCEGARGEIVLVEATE